MARKVTQNAVNAFLAGQPWAGGNTSVGHEDFEVDGEIVRGTVLRLHGNAIARRLDDGRIWVSDGGWQTHTTKERLNGLPGISVSQRDFAWYLSGPERRGRTDSWDGSWAQVA